MFEELFASSFSTAVVALAVAASADETMSSNDGGDDNLCLGAILTNQYKSPI